MQKELSFITYLHMANRSMRQMHNISKQLLEYLDSSNIKCIFQADSQTEMLLLRACLTAAFFPQIARVRQNNSRSIYIFVFPSSFIVIGVSLTSTDSMKLLWCLICLYRKAVTFVIQLLIYQIRSGGGVLFFVCFTLPEAPEYFCFYTLADSNMYVLLIVIIIF